MVEGHGGDEHASPYGHNHRERSLGGAGIETQECREDASLLLASSRFSTGWTPSMMPLRGFRRIDWRLIYLTSGKGYSPKFLSRILRSPAVA
jgi:hypothetical protein